MSLAEHFAECDHCGGYVITGTYRLGRTLSSRCKCDDREERADLEPKELPNGRFQVAA
jgi:hypothetical protein